jgi:hypothetical protein
MSDDHTLMRIPMRFVDDVAAVLHNGDEAGGYVGMLNRLGRITEELGLPWGASASRIIEVIRSRDVCARCGATKEREG